jgi:integral membrane protein (TIGR01906 family)
MNLIARISTVLFIVALPVFLITANVRFAAGDSWFYKHGFRENEVDQTTGVDFAQLDAAADNIVRYFEDDRSTLNIQVTTDGREGPLYSAKEVEHMRDVKGLMRVVFRLNELSFGIIVAYIGAVVLWTRERTPRDLAKYALLGVAVGLVVVAGIGAFAVTGFDAAWTKFHEIAFQNDLWQLDPDKDRLIQMFPEPFWEEMTYLVGILTVVEVLAVVVVAAGYLIWGRDRLDMDLAREG